MKVLEDLVEKMEQGDLDLADSLSCFEKGIALTRSCQKSLTEAEQKIQMLTSEDGTQRLKPFLTDESSEEE